MRRYSARALLVGRVARAAAPSRARLLHLLDSDKDKFDQDGWTMPRHDLCLRLSLLGPGAVTDLCDLYRQSFKSWNTFKNMVLYRIGPFALAKGLLDLSDPSADPVPREPQCGPRLLNLIAKDRPGPRPRGGRAQERSVSTSRGSQVQESAPEAQSRAVGSAVEASTGTPAHAESDCEAGGEIQEPQDTVRLVSPFFGGSGLPAGSLSPTAM